MKSQLKKYRNTLKVMSHPLSMDIFEFILENKGAKVNVIYKALKIEQSVCSAALGKLRKAKLVVGVKQSREMHYDVSKNSIREILNSIRKEICGK
jgi:DNA-binding transcriptional ArsR family regulator